MDDGPAAEEDGAPSLVWRRDLSPMFLMSFSVAEKDLQLVRGRGQRCAN